MKRTALVSVCAYVLLAPLLFADVEVAPGGVPATGTVGVPYSGTVSARKGNEPYRFSVASGTLPNGLSLSSGGDISGTPTAAGIFVISILVTDRYGDSASRLFVIAIAPALVSPLSISTTSPLPNGTVSSAYSQSLKASGGTPPYRWSGSAPAGLSLATDGSITGTPTAAGNFNFNATVTDNVSRTASRSFAITINPPLLTIMTNSPLPAGSLGAPYSNALAASGGIPPYRWSGAAPAGLTLSTSGVISGTPSAAGTFNFTVTLTDSSPSSTVSRSFAITIQPAALIITTGALPVASTGASYSQQLSATGGVTPLTWSIIGGQLPPGLSLGPSNGVISGTANTAGSFIFIVEVRDNSSLAISKQYSITVEEGQALTISSGPALPGGTAGAVYSGPMLAAGGIPPYVWSISSGTLPAGLTLDPGSGMIAGLPAMAGTYDFAAQVRDSRGTVATRQFTITIARNLVITTSPALPSPVSGTLYSTTLIADGGTPPYNWVVVNGSLPDGLSIAPATGLIAGMPGAAGQFSFLVQVNDSVGAVSSRQFSATVQALAMPALSITSIPDVASATQQLTVDLNLASAYPFPITGQVTMSFVPDVAIGDDDPAVQFSTGGRSVSFTIPANSTQPASPIALQTGSVAGTIELQVTAPGTETPGLNRSIRIARSAPLIRNLSVVRNPAGFELRLVGLSTPRELTRATVRFNGTGLDTTEVNIPLADLARNWYNSETSRPFGSQFSLVIPFTIQGDQNAVQSATLTVSNAEGASAPLIAELGSR